MELKIVKTKLGSNIRHADMLDHELNVGDYVATPYRNSLEIFVVSRQTPKMVMLSHVDDNQRWEERKYPRDLIKLEHTDHLLLWVMKKKGGLT